jgi:DNA polymerase I-like protein with 3'-5' exonuclease and polymerase domains
VKIIVCGGRDYANRALVWSTLDTIAPDVVIHGTTSGADTLAKRWAQKRGVTEKPFPAKWKLYGKAAGPIRNRRMLKERPDLVVAFPGKKGTANMVKQARRAGIEVRKVRDPKKPKKSKKTKKVRVEVSSSTPAPNLKEAGISVLIDTVEKFQSMAKEIKALPRNSVCVIDTETASFNRVYDNRLLSSQFCFDGYTGYVVPFRHPKTPFSADQLQSLANIHKDLFTTPTAERIFWCFAEAKFDLHQIRREFEVEVTNNPNIDIMQAAYLNNENRIFSRDPQCYYQGEKGLSLEVLTRVYLGEKFAVVKDDKLDRRNIINWSMERFIPYAGGDTWRPWRILQEQLKEAEEEGYRRALLRLLLHLYSPANLLVVEVEQNGFKIDIDYVRTLRGRNSLMLQEKRRLEGLMRKSKACKKANRILAGAQAKGRRFIGGETPWMFNPGNDEHCRRLFFDVLGYEPLTWTEAEEPKPQVNKAFRERVAEWDSGEQPTNEAALVDDWVSIDKMLTSFVNPFYKRVDPDRGDPDMAPDCRVRSRQKLMHTTTGRIAAEKPSTAQIPRGDNEWKKGVKKMFIVEEGNALFSADLKANEVVWADINSQDRKLGALFWECYHTREKFRKTANALSTENRALYQEVLQIEGKAKYSKEDGSAQNPEAERLNEIKAHKEIKKLLRQRADVKVKDIHRMTASDFYEIPVEDVTDEQRQDTKSIIFGYIAARGVKAIAQQIKKSEEETLEKCKAFDRKFPTLARYLSKCSRLAEKVGYIEAPNGRRRRFASEIWQEEEWIQAKARRQARNNLIQGVASDAMICACIVLLDYIRKENKSWKILNMVHDAIYMEAPISESAEVVKAMEWCLTTGTIDYMTKNFDINFVCPLSVDIEVGLAWGSAYKWDGTEPHLEVVINNVKTDHTKKYGKDSAH